MKIWREPIEFDWDQGNIGKNLKHNVEDKEAEETFTNKPILFQRILSILKRNQDFRLLVKQMMTDYYLYHLP